MPLIIIIIWRQNEQKTTCKSFGFYGRSRKRQKEKREKIQSEDERQKSR